MENNVVFKSDLFSVRLWSTAVFDAKIYLVEPAIGGEALLVDAGGRAAQILSYLKQSGSNLKWIALTHKHLDHTAAAWWIKWRSKSRIVGGLSDMNRAKSFRNGGDGLEDGDILEVGNVSVKVIATPGHTKGGISLSLPGAVFTGDTLFAGTIGRTDMAGGDLKAILKSIREKLIDLPDDTAVFPGHGPASTIGREKTGNPFVNGEYSE